MIQTVYKVVRIINDKHKIRMCSSNGSTIPGAVLIYNLNQRRKPTIPKSKLFAFCTFKEAKNYLDNDLFPSIHYRVVKCDALVADAESLDSIPRIRLWMLHATRRNMVDFWSIKTHFSFSTTLCPLGTVMCEWITPREIMYDSQENL